MAALGSLQHIFEKPLPENPSLLESLSPWNQIKSTKPIDDHSSFTEIFGELHFKENLGSITPSARTRTEAVIDYDNEKSPMSDYFSTTSRKSTYHKNSDSFSSMNSESLQLCTEGLGFESFDDVEDLKMEFDDDWKNNQNEKMRATRVIRGEGFPGEIKKMKNSDFQFPPPISCIGKSGKPWVCFKSYRQDGRFVLKEIRIPTQEFLHSKREDGRLKLQFFQPEDEITEEDGEGEEEEDDKEDYEETTNYCEENDDIKDTDDEKANSMKAFEVHDDT